MSKTADRDLAAELEAPEAGRNGTPVDARCVSCKRVRAKFASKIRGSPGSFQHVCHVCCRVTWWNIIDDLENVVDDETLAELEEVAQ
jgi:hypothetical protein